MILSPIHLLFALGMCTCGKAFLFQKNILIGHLLSDRFWRKNVCHSDTTIVLSLRKESRDENDNDEDSTLGSQLNLPALGPAGTSSNDSSSDAASTDDFSKNGIATTDSSNIKNNEHKASVRTFVNPKFALQYTCNVCQTKNRVLISRQAYQNGMVIAVCKGCKNKHWIADNLDPTLPTKNIEEYFESQGMNDVVNRVSEEVYEIERVWGLKEGEIKDDSGNKILE